MSKGPPLGDGETVLVLLLICLIAAGGVWMIVDIVRQAVQALASG